MVKIRFTRDTKRSEGKRLFLAGQEAEVSTSSARHWFSRNAAIPVKAATAAPEGLAAHNRTVKAMEQQFAEIANAQVDNSAPDGSGAGDGAKPDAGASTVGAAGGRSGNRSK